jgi:hypothetical protein
MRDTDTLQEKRDAARLHCRSEGFLALRDYLLFRAEEMKESLLVNRGHAADECRGYVRHLRNALRNVDADEKKRTKTSPYA